MNKIIPTPRDKHPDPALRGDRISGERYYSNKARLVAVFCALIVSFTYVAGQMRGVGIVFSRFLEIPIESGVIVGMIIVLFYAVLVV